MSPYKRFVLLTKSALCAILLIIALVIFKSCDKKKLNSLTQEHLNGNEKSAVIVSPSGQISVVTRNGSSGAGVRSALLRGRQPNTGTDATESRQELAGNRGVRISIDDRGNVSVKSRSYGLICEPGIGLYSTTGHAGVVVDAQVLFYKRHGLNLGLGMALGSKQIRPTIAYSYLLPFEHFSNTSLFLGIDSDKSLLLGTRVKF